MKNKNTEVKDVEVAKSVVENACSKCVLKKSLLIAGAFTVGAGLGVLIETVFRKKIAPAIARAKEVKKQKKQAALNLNRAGSEEDFEN